MVRSFVLAAMLGAMVVAGAAYAVSQAASQNFIALWFRGAERMDEAALGMEGWPICTAMALVTSDADGLDPDFAAGKKSLGAGDWATAITALKLAALRDPRNADIQNYIGYAYRRLRQLGPAMHHYQLALMFNRRQRSAHEHLGELYLVLGEPAKAKEHLTALEEICLIPCEEFGDLKRAIAAYEGRAMR
jgi:tetratricopeptide (TPR) repeat protein